jgi:hypothetical protein
MKMRTHKKRIRKSEGGAPVSFPKRVRAKTSARLKKITGRHSTSNRTLWVKVSGTWVALDRLCIAVLL